VQSDDNTSHMTADNLLSYGKIQHAMLHSKSTICDRFYDEILVSASLFFFVP